MKKNILLFISSMILAVLASSCQNGLQNLKQPNNGITIAYYNIENLFDTINDPKINDEDFLPNAKVKWNSERYYAKLDNIAKVIAAMDTLDFPHIVGLEEIENLAVLKDLIANKHIKKAAYEIIHIEDHDPRGIEVAMLYQPKYFRIAHTQAIPVFLEGYERSNRHILYVKGTIATGDTLHLFVNHWTSRYGGKEETIPARTGTANVLRYSIDSLFAINPSSNIIIGGDFNDNPDDASIFSFLKAYAPSEETAQATLYNLAMKTYLEGNGTLYYDGWDCFDQIIVSSALLQNGKLKAGPLEIIKKDWMLFKPRDGEARPNRTASGSRYFGGFSDHLPVMVRLQKQ
ncbi:MAG: endonuclease [Bacteroidetes bacterium HGW-Bacteroidetes-1]|jgi:endonuclease/exonuclease/phosphatase family metal-dependent hydrolase|nr:MAG: endonuclease [Bacteroidetes bacterium HGW-Bacteroidetes-1]